MDINGDADGPPTKVGFYIGDLVTPLFAAYSIMGALREKESAGGGGRGQHLDVSMMDTLAALMFMENLEEDVQQGVPSAYRQYQPGRPYRPVPRLQRRPDHHRRQRRPVAAAV